MRQPSLKLVPQWVFCFLPTPQSGLVDGPRWAALKKHIGHARPTWYVPALARGLETGLGECDASAPIPDELPIMCTWGTVDRSATLPENPLRSPGVAMPKP